MIYCKLSDLDSYKNYSENMKEAISFIQKNNLNSLPFGKTVVNGEKVFINKMEVNVQDYNQLQYEVHHKYIDIHIDLIGDEKLFIRNKDDNCTSPFDDEGDYALYKSTDPDLVCNIDQNYCAICLPFELHMPCVKNSTEVVTKCVVKVLDNSK